MARFSGGLPDDLIKLFSELEINTEKMIGEMVEAGAEVALNNVKAKMPKNLRAGLNDSNIRISRVYKTPSDDGINCQAMVDGYFTNKEGKKTPAPLVANLFEYGRSGNPYPKQPFFRSSFNRKQIETAMKKVQDKYIKED